MKNRKRILMILLSLILFVSCMPMMAAAEGENGTEGNTGIQNEAPEGNDQGTINNGTNDPANYGGGEDGKIGTKGDDNNGEPDQSDEVTISFIAEGATFKNFEPVSLYTKGEDVYPPGRDNVIKDGYILAGWSEADEKLVWDAVKDEGKPICKASETTKYYAVWKKAYKITFDANGGTIDYNEKQQEKVTVVVGENEKTDILWADRKGYRFLGWTDADGKLVWDADDENWDKMSVTATKDETFYAKWDRVYRITFDANGGYFEDEGYLKEKGSYPSTYWFELKPGEDIWPAPDPVREGYKFLGWSKKKEGGSLVAFYDNNTGKAFYQAAESNDGDVYYAQWSKKGSSGNGGKGVNTGDHNDVSGWIMMFSAAGLALAGLLKKRVKGNASK